MGDLLVFAGINCYSCLKEKKKTKKIAQEEI
jgi:hypothetical protein